MQYIVPKQEHRPLRARLAIQTTRPPIMHAMLNNLINGNLTDAKTQAKRYPLFVIARHAMESLGYTRNKAIMAAAYLKGRATFQAYRDAV